MNDNDNANDNVNNNVNDNANDNVRRTLNINKCIDHVSVAVGE